ncbi:MAG: SAM-dependent chlorinase/fluorinase [Candidatus Eisenbacteria bacterium]
MTERRIITILTDFGEGSYVPSVKGVLLSTAPGAVLVDMSHDILPGAVGTASFILAHTAPYFPEGTVHLAVVDPGVGTGRLALVVEAGGSFFVGPDNGLFGEVLRRRGGRAWQIEEGPWMPPRISPTFHGRDIFAPVAARLALGEKPERFGSPVDPADLAPSPIEPPRRAGSRVSGEVVWVDRFGNLITNLDRPLVEEWTAGAPFRALVGGTWIDTRVHTFLEAKQGSLVVLFGSWETVEISVAAGSASRRLGIASGEPVHLERIHGR